MAWKDKGAEPLILHGYMMTVLVSSEGKPLKFYIIKMF